MNLFFKRHKGVVGIVFFVFAGLWFASGGIQQHLQAGTDKTYEELKAMGHEIQAEVRRAEAGGDQTDDGPIVRLTNLIIDEAVRMGRRILVVGRGVNREAQLIDNAACSRANGDATLVAGQCGAVRALLEAVV